MFTTDCFIRKNSASLRRKLEKIGYVPANGNSSENDSLSYLCLLSYIDAN